MSPITALVLALLAFAGVACAAGEPRDLLLRDVRLIDGTDAPPREHVSIRVRGGRVTAIASGLAANGARVVSGRHLTVMPGLIDAHVHLSGIAAAAVPLGRSFAQHAFDPVHLRGYLACGVTTVLDAGFDPRATSAMRRVRGMRPGPRVLLLGPPFLTPGGYLSPPLPGVSNVSDVDAMFAKLDAIGVVGVKVVLEHGFFPLGEWLIHAPEIREAIVREARARRLPIYVHATSERDQLLALEMGARAVMHAVEPWRGEDVSEDFVRQMADSRVHVVTTFAVMDAPLAEFHRERLLDPLVLLAVPSAERGSAANANTGARFRAALIGLAMPWLPSALRAPIADRVLNEDAMRQALAASQAAVRRLHGAGVPIVVGTDSGSGPYAFHGPTTIRELELLADAGLPPADVLAAATRLPAAMLGVADQVGTVEVGKRADLIVVAADPLLHPSALRAARLVVKDGIARTPAQWMGYGSGRRPHTTPAKKPGKMSRIRARSGKT